MTPASGLKIEDESGCWRLTRIIKKSSVEYELSWDKILKGPGDEFGCVGFTEIVKSDAMYVVKRG